MLKTIALGALGYLGYRYYTSQNANSSKSGNAGKDEVRLAGGPLSENAKVVHPSASA